MDWELHKETIRHQYLVMDMTKQEVMEEMEKTCRFKAKYVNQHLKFTATDLVYSSAGQYERQFKKWGFRKNFTPKEW